MNVFIRAAAACFFSLAALATHAKTVTYEIDALRTMPGYVNYPGLDLNAAKTATITVIKNTQTSPPELTRLEITFPSAATLTATNFKIVNGRYRALVKDAWIYRQVMVEIPMLDPRSRAPFQADVFISERNNVINPEMETPGQRLFSLNGMLRDVSPNPVVDSVISTVNGKQVTLNLKERPAVAEPGPNAFGPQEGFVIDSNWYGRGAKTIYFQAPFANYEFDNFIASSIQLIDIDTPMGRDTMIAIKFRSPSGASMLTPQMRLKDFLEMAYGPQMP